MIVQFLILYAAIWWYALAMHSAAAAHHERERRRELIRSIEVMDLMRINPKGSTEGGTNAE